jgi:hypothetical protein
MGVAYLDVKYVAMVIIRIRFDSSQNDEALEDRLIT